MVLKHVFDILLKEVSNGTENTHLSQNDFRNENETKKYVKTKNIRERSCVRPENATTVLVFFST